MVGLNLVWAIAPGQAPLVAARLERVLRGEAPAQAAADQAAKTARSRPAPVNGLRVLELRGRMVKGFAWRWFGEMSTDQLADDVRQAAADPAVNAIAIIVDSPGGQVAGTFDLAAAIAEAAAVKRVTAIVEDLAASAALVAISGASQIVASPWAWLGSIGVLVLALDLSEAFAREGLRTVVVKSGNFKGSLSPGVPITDADIQALQQIVDTLADQVNATIARGRKISLDAVAKLADGRIFPVDVARAAGLVDRIEKPAEALARLRAEAEQLATAARIARGEFRSAVEEFDFRVAQECERWRSDPTDTVPNSEEDRRRAAGCRIKSWFPDLAARLKMETESNRG